VIGWCNAGGYCSDKIDVHHVKSRGAGGTYKDLAPLCAWHHHCIHNEGKKTFAKRHSKDLAAVANSLFVEHYRERGICREWDGDNNDCTGHQCDCGEGLCGACCGCEEER